MYLHRYNTHIRLIGYNIYFRYQQTTFWFCHTTHLHKCIVRAVPAELRAAL